MFKEVYYPTEEHSVSFGQGTGELSAELHEVQETPEVAENRPEVQEVAENNEFVEIAEAGEEKGEMLGYSSEYYKHQMAKAIENDNKIAYDNAKRDYAKAIVREETKKMK